MDFDLENVEQRKHCKDSRVTKVLNKNLEQYQYPRYDEYKSLTGFSNMNYSRVKQSAQDMQYLKNRRGDTQQQLDHLYQQQFHSDFYQEQPVKKPFHTILNQTRNQEHAYDNDLVVIKQDGTIYNKHFGQSNFQLANASLESKVELQQQKQEYYQKYSQYEPNNNHITTLDWEPKQLPGVDTIDYCLPQDESTRHLQSLPSQVITQASLQNILNMSLTSLNLHNHHWIPIPLISKIGFLAKNIQTLNLGGLDISDEVLVELSISCGQLCVLDISSCARLTEKGVQQSLDNLKGRLVQLNGYNNPNSFTSISLLPLAQASQLTHINLGYCNHQDKTNRIQLKNILLGSQARIISLQLPRCTSIDPNDITEVVAANTNTLEVLDVSYIQSNDLHRNFMKEIQKCKDLVELDLTGCSQISDEAFQSLLLIERPSLQYLNICGLKDITEQSLIKLCNIASNLKYLNCNGLLKLSDQCVLQLCKLACKLQILNINNTPHVQPETVQNILSTRTINQVQLNIIHHSHKMVDPKFNGLLMPLIGVAKQNALIKVKKKKKKK